MLTELQRQALNSFMFRDRSQDEEYLEDEDMIVDFTDQLEEDTLNVDIDQPSIEEQEQKQKQEIIVPDQDGPTIPFPKEATAEKEQEGKEEVPSIVNDVAPPTRNKAYIEIANQAILRPMDIQIARLENNLDSKYATDDSKKEIQTELDVLKRERDEIQKQITADNYSLITDFSKDISSYTKLDGTDDAIKAEEFLKADTAQIKTIDAYVNNPLINKVAMDFFNELGEKAWKNASADEMMYYFRKEVSLDDMIRRATQVGDWSDEQKQRYLWLRETFDNTSWTESRLSRKLEAVGEYTWQVIWDPATTVTLLTAPFTGGGSVAARASAQAASKVAFRHMLLNGLKNNLSANSIKQVASRIVSKESYSARALKNTLFGTPARTNMTYGFTYGSIADNLIQEKAIGLNQQDEKDYYRIIKNGGLFALAGGTLGKVIDSTPGAAKYLATSEANPLFFQTIIGNPSKKVMYALRQAATAIDTTSGRRLSTGLSYMRDGIDITAGLTFGKATSVFKRVVDITPGLRPFANAMNAQWDRRLIGTSPSKTDTPEQLSMIQEYGSLAGDFGSRLKLILTDNKLRKGIFGQLKGRTPREKKYGPSGEKLSTGSTLGIHKLDDVTNNLLSTTVRSMTSRGPRKNTTPFTATGRLRLDFKRQIEEAGQGYYTVDNFLNAAKEIRKLDDEILKIAKNTGLIDKSVRVVGHMPRMWSEKILDPANKTKMIDHFVKTGQAKNKEIATDIYNEMIDKSLMAQRYGASAPYSGVAGRKLTKIKDDELADLLDNDVESVFSSYFDGFSKLIAENNSFGLPTQARLLVDPKNGKFVPLKGSEVGSKLAPVLKQAIKDIDALDVSVARKKLLRFQLKRLEKTYQYTVGNVPRIENKALRFASEAAQVGVQLGFLPLATVTSISEAFIPLAHVNAPTYAKNMMSVIGLQGKKTVRNIYNAFDLNQTNLAKLNVGYEFKKGSIIPKKTEGKKLGEWLNKTEAFEEANKVMLFMDQAAMQRVETLYSADIQNKGLKAVQRLFFRANLLAEWTKTVELASFMMGKDMIRTNLSKINKGGYTKLSLNRYRDELETLGINVDEGVKFIRGDMKAKEMLDFEKKIMLGGQRFARQIILNPKVDQQVPLWLQDPHTAAFTQLLSYPFAFGNVVVKSFGHNMTKGPVEASRTALAGTLMTMAGVLGNEWRTGGTSWGIPTPYEQTDKTVSFDTRPQEEVVLGGMKRVGFGAGGTEYVANVNKNLIYADYGKNTKWLKALRGISGPSLGDAIMIGMGELTLAEALAMRLPGFTAYPKEVQQDILRGARDKTHDFKEGTWRYLASKGVVDPEQVPILGIFANKPKDVYTREPKRKTKFEGGEISEDFPVPNVKKEPSEMINKATGLPYEAEMERLGMEDGGLLVSIGVAPVSEKQIGKLKKGLKKRKAMREGGEIRQRYAFGDRIRKVLPTSIKTYVDKVVLGNREAITEKDFKENQMKILDTGITDKVRRGIKSGEYFLTEDGQLKSIRNQAGNIGSKSNKETGYFIDLDTEGLDEDIFRTIGSSGVSINKEKPNYNIIDEYDFAFEFAGKPTARGFNKDNIEQYRLYEEAGRQDASNAKLDWRGNKILNYALPLAERYGAGQLPDKLTATQLSKLEGKEVMPESVNINIGSALNIDENEWAELMGQANTNRNNIDSLINAEKEAEVLEQIKIEEHFDKVFGKEKEVIPLQK